MNSALKTIDLRILAGEGNELVEAMAAELEGPSREELPSQWPTRFISAGPKTAPSRWTARFIAAGGKGAPPRWSTRFLAAGPKAAPSRD